MLRITKQKKTIVKNNLLAYQYVGYISEAIRNRIPFKYSEVNQLGARLSGKTTSDNIELVRAIIAAGHTKQKLFISILRMRHNMVAKAWKDIIGVLNMFRIPFKTWTGEKRIQVWTTKIQVIGCYTTNSNEITLLGYDIQDAKCGEIVFEEAKEFDEKTINAVLVAVRGDRHQTVIYRSNPYLLSWWYVKKCYKEVMFDINILKHGTGNQFVEKDDKVYHYMNCWVNPFLSSANITYLKGILKNNPTLAETEIMVFLERPVAWSLRDIWIR